MLLKVKTGGKHTYLTYSFPLQDIVLHLLYSFR